MGRPKWGGWRSPNGGVGDLEDHAFHCENMRLRAYFLSSYEVTKPSGAASWPCGRRRTGKEADKGRSRGRGQGVVRRSAKMWAFPPELTAERRLAAFLGRSLLSVENNAPTARWWQPETAKGGRVPGPQKT